MDVSKRTAAGILVLTASFLLSSPSDGHAQGRDKVVSNSATISVTLSSDMKVRIREFYTARQPSGVKPLPPGIRKRLARGKPLPPGIAKQVVPNGLSALLRLPPGYQAVEVGLDVLLVEVATNVIHDVLMDVVT